MIGATNHNLARFDAAPYGVYRWAGEVAPRRKRPDNGVATMGRGQWHNSLSAGQAAD